MHIYLLQLIVPDPERHKIEKQLRMTIRDAVNRSTRKLRMAIYLYRSKD
jgi:hypothetical protein